jgi:hypothetical protein
VIARASLAALLLVFAACRAESGRDSARVATAGADARAAPSDTGDGCEQTSGQRPDTAIAPGTAGIDSWRRAFARGAEYRCVIDPTLTLRLVLAGDTTAPRLDSIRVLTDTGGRQIQLLRLGSEVDMPMPYTLDVLRALDLDADGDRDLLLGTTWGATGNTGYAVWRFDAASRRFVGDSVLSTLTNLRPVPGRPCVFTSNKGSAVDGGSGLYCLHDGRWLLDSAETTTSDRDAHTIVHERLARRGDSLVLLDRSTRPDSM